MNSYVVQFGDLDEMVGEMRNSFAEQTAGQPWPPMIRVFHGELALYKGNTNMPNPQVIAVHVRTIDHARNTILACMVVVGSYQKLYGEAFGPHEEEKAKKAWAAAEALQERIRGHLNRNFPHARVGFGILDIGETVLQAGGWAAGQPQTNEEE